MFDALPQLIANTLVPAMIFALIAAGFSLIYSVTRVLDLAVGAVAIGAGYMFFSFALGSGLPILIAATLAIAGAVALELLIAFAIYEPLRRRRILSTAISLIASLSALHIIQNVILAVYGPLTKSFSRIPTASRVVGGAEMTDIEIYAVVVPAVLLVLLFWFLHETKWGRAIRATSDHEEVAEIIGINVRKIRYLVYVIAGICAGAGGILFALEFNLEPNMPVMTAVRMFSRTLIGGVGSVPGAVLGSFLSQIAVEFGTFFWKTQAQEAATFVLAFAVLLFRPQGILGKKN